MHKIYQRWDECAPRTRVFCWCIASGAVLLIVWLVLIRPASGQYLRAQRQLQQANDASAVLWTIVRRQPALPEAGAATRRRPFSPLDLQGNGSRLVQWKPMPGGGALTLDVVWSAVPAIFSRLARQDVRIAGFAITAHQTQLRISMQLELDHGP